MTGIITNIAGRGRAMRKKASGEKWENLTVFFTIGVSLGITVGTFITNMIWIGVS